MERTRYDDADRTVPTEQPELENYLPAMFWPSNEPGRVERFLKRLFRRRGGLRVVVRQRGQ